jgi:hypothetical protein
LGTVGCGEAQGRLHLVDPTLTVEVIEFRRAQIDSLLAAVARVVDCFTEQDALTRCLGTDSACEQPQLARAVFEVFDVDSADIVCVEHGLR